MKISFKKIINLSILILVFFNPILIFANETLILNQNTPPRAIIVQEPLDLSGQTLRPDFVNSQIQNSISSANTNPGQSSQNGGFQNGAVGVASCFGSQIVAKAIVDNVTGLAGRVTDTILNVPVAESGQVGAAQKTEVSARVGSGVSLFGLSIPTLPSWDAMAYCIVNTMIIYIADSTIDWVNTGFEGNPAFLNNPDQFFTDLANQEKINFLEGLAYGVNSNVCGVYKSPILSALLSRYGRNQQYNQGYETGGYGYGYNQNGSINSCAFDNNPGQLNTFLNTSFSEGGGWNAWFEVTQNPVNNPYDTYFNSIDNLNQSVESIKINKERELTWNNGYLSFRKCENGEKDTGKCSITTPGTAVQSQLESTLNLGKNRLVLADKFDQVVTAVVDQLITTALDKTFEQINEGVEGVNESISGGLNNSNRNSYRNPWQNTDINPYYDNSTININNSINNFNNTSTTTNQINSSSNISTTTNI